MGCKQGHDKMQQMEFLATLMKQSLVRKMCTVRAYLVLFVRKIKADAWSSSFFTLWRYLKQMASKLI